MLTFSIGEPVYPYADQYMDGKGVPFSHCALGFTGRGDIPYFLAPWSLLSLSNRVGVARDGKIVPIGTIHNHLGANGENGFSETCVQLMGSFSLNEGVHVQGADLSDRRFLSPANVLQRRARILRQDEKSSESESLFTGYVCHENCCTAFPKPGGFDETDYSGLYRMAPNNTGDEFANLCDIGSLVETEDGSLLGILVGIRSGYGYAVPIESVLTVWRDTEGADHDVVKSIHLEQFNEAQGAGYNISNSLDEANLTDLPDIFRAWPLERLHQVIPDNANFREKDREAMRVAGALVELVRRQGGQPSSVISTLEGKEVFIGGVSLEMHVLAASYYSQAVREQEEEVVG